MENKTLIAKLKDNAELAQAAYGYFHLVGKKFKDALDDDEIPLSITLENTLDIAYNGYKVEDTGLIFDDKLKGDFTPTQAQRFFEHYELIHHIPNTISGYSATLFYENHSKSYTLAFRGTETSVNGIMTDWTLANTGIILGFALPQFISLWNLKNEIISIVEANSKQHGNNNNEAGNQQTHNKKLIVTGHSLGGHLAQGFCVFYHNNTSALYTYNAPGFFGVWAILLFYSIVSLHYL